MTQNVHDSALNRPETPPELRLATVRPEPGRPGDAHEPALPRDRNQAILEAAKQVGATLKRAGHEFALAGSVAVYAHGGAGNLQHDADFCIEPGDVESVASTLREAGLTVYTPPENWLLKATCRRVR